MTPNFGEPEGTARKSDLLAAMIMSAGLAMSALGYLTSALAIQFSESVSSNYLPIPTTISNVNSIKQQGREIQPDPFLMRIALASQPLNPKLVNLAVVDGARQLPPSEVVRHAEILNRLGWRETVVVQNRLALALEQQNATKVLDQLDALMRRNRLFNETSLVFNNIELDEDGRILLATRLMADPPWRINYLINVQNLRTPSRLRARGLLLTEMQGRGDRLRRPEIAPLMEPMVGADLAQQAAMLWREHTRADVNQPVLDPQFNNIGSNGPSDDWPVPFEWRTLPGPGYSVTPLVEDGEGKIRIDWNGRGAPVFLFQRLASVPENVTASLTIDGKKSVAAERLEVSLSCPRARHVMHARSGGSGSVLRLSLREPLSCRAPLLVIAGKLNDGDALSNGVIGLGELSFTIVLDEIALKS